MANARGEVRVRHAIEDLGVGSGVTRTGAELGDAGASRDEGRVTALLDRGSAVALAGIGTRHAVFPSRRVRRSRIRARCRSASAWNGPISASAMKQARHASPPGTQAGQEPPQSTPVSVPFWTPSVQVGGWGKRGTGHRNRCVPRPGSGCRRCRCGRGPRGVGQGPPQSMPPSPWFWMPSVQVARDDWLAVHVARGRAARRVARLVASRLRDGRTGAIAVRTVDDAIAADRRDDAVPCSAAWPRRTPRFLR